MASLGGRPSPSTGPIGAPCSTGTSVADDCRRRSACLHGDLGAETAIWSIVPPRYWAMTGTPPIFTAASASTPGGRPASISSAMRCSATLRITTSAATKSARTRDHDRGDEDGGRAPRGPDPAAGVAARSGAGGAAIGSACGCCRRGGRMTSVPARRRESPGRPCVVVVLGRGRPGTRRWGASGIARPASHALRRGDAEQVEPVAQDLAGGVVEPQARAVQVARRARRRAGCTRQLSYQRW